MGDHIVRGDIGRWDHHREGLEVTMVERVILGLMVLFGAAVGIWVLIMAYDSEPPFRYLPESDGSYVSPDPAGQMATVRTMWRLSDVDRECPRTVQRKYYDLSTGELVTSQDTLPISIVTNKNQKYISRSFQLPPDLPARTGYQVDTCFRCNLLRQVFPVCITSPRLTINVAH